MSGEVVPVPNTVGVPEASGEKGTDTASAPAETVEEVIREVQSSEAGLVLDALAEVSVTRKAQLAAIRRDGRKPKAALENPQPKGGRGHFKQHLKTQLSQSGKLNAKKPMPPDQKRLRKRKRKR